MPFLSWFFRTVCSVLTLLIHLSYQLPRFLSTGIRSAWHKNAPEKSFSGVLDTMLLLRYSAMLQLFSDKKGFSCHFLRLLFAHQLDQSGHNICQAAAISQGIGRIRIYQDERYLIGRVCCMRRTGSIVDHLLCVSMIRTDKQLSVYLLDRFHCLSNAFIYHFNGLHCCINHT